MFFLDAWQVWRRSPGYTPRAVWATAGITLGLIGAIIAAVQIGLLALIVVMLVGTSAASAAIIRVTDGPWKPRPAWVEWGDVSFGPDGMRCGKEFLPWARSGRYLLHARQTDRLEFRFYWWGRGIVTKTV